MPRFPLSSTSTSSRVAGRAHSLRPSFLSRFLLILLLFALSAMAGDRNRNSGLGGIPDHLRTHSVPFGTPILAAAPTAERPSDRASASTAQTSAPAAAPPMRPPASSGGSSTQQAAPSNGAQLQLAPPSGRQQADTAPPSSSQQQGQADQRSAADQAEEIAKLKALIQQQQSNAQRQALEAEQRERRIRELERSFQQQLDLSRQRVEQRPVSPSQRPAPSRTRTSSPAPQQRAQAESSEVNRLDDATEVSGPVLNMVASRIAVENAGAAARDAKEDTKKVSLPRIVPGKKADPYNIGEFGVTHHVSFSLRALAQRAARHRVPVTGRVSVSTWVPGMGRGFAWTWSYRTVCVAFAFNTRRRATLEALAPPHCLVAASFPAGMGRSVSRRR